MNKTLKLCATAMLIALSVAANAISIPLSGSNYLSFTFIPSFIAAIYLGITPAVAVGFLGDLIAGFLFPKGTYNILIGLSSTLIALIPAILYKFFPRHRRLNLFLSMLLCTVVCTSGLNTYAMWLMFGAKNGKTFWVYLWGRLPFQLLNTAVNTVLIGILQESKVIDRLFGRLSVKKDRNKKQSENNAAKPEKKVMISETNRDESCCEAKNTASATMNDDAFNDKYDAAESQDVKHNRSAE